MGEPNHEEAYARAQQHLDGPWLGWNVGNHEPASREHLDGAR